MTSDHLQCRREQRSACWATAVGRRAGRTHGGRPAGQGRRDKPAARWVLISRDYAV